MKKSRVYEWNHAGGTGNAYNAAMGILSAIFSKCTYTTLFAKLCNIGAHFWPPYT